MIQRSRIDLLVATYNPGKVKEIKEALRDLPLELHSLEEFPDVAPAEEAGRTYEDNAILKAVHYSKQAGLCALADDSGLEVDALEGMPGVFSARFGGYGASDHDRIEKLLKALSQHQRQQRTARFICSMALAKWQAEDNLTSNPGAYVLNAVEGRCEGVIADELRGTNGFGYDPVFIPVGYNETFAELPYEVKQRISHRGQALTAMRKFLERWLTQT